MKIKYKICGIHSQSILLVEDEKGERIQIKFTDSNSYFPSYCKVGDVISIEVEDEN